MIVKCINNNRESLSDVYFTSEFENEIYFQDPSTTKSDLFPIIIGKEYVVYAMAINNNDIWYFIADENYVFYPIWKPAPLFQIVDNQLSKYWVFSHTTGINFIQAQTFWAFPEWAEDPDFYTKLTSSYEREIFLFEKYKKLMDAETL